MIYKSDILLLKLISPFGKLLEFLQIKYGNINLYIFYFEESGIRHKEKVEARDWVNLMSSDGKLKQELQVIAEKLADIEAEMEEYK